MYPLIHSPLDTEYVRGLRCGLAVVPPALVDSPDGEKFHIGRQPDLYRGGVLPGNNSRHFRAVCCTIPVTQVRPWRVWGPRRLRFRLPVPLPSGGVNAIHDVEIGMPRIDSRIHDRDFDCLAFARGCQCSEPGWIAVPENPLNTPRNLLAEKDDWASLLFDPPHPLMCGQFRNGLPWNRGGHSSDVLELMSHRSSGCNHPRGVVRRRRPSQADEDVNMVLFGLQTRRQQGPKADDSNENDSRSPWAVSVGQKGLKELKTFNVPPRVFCPEPICSVRFVVLLVFCSFSGMAERQLWRDGSQWFLPRGVFMMFPLSFFFADVFVADVA
jgi:hypothetical protein